MILIILFNLLLTFTILFFFGNFFGKRGSALLSIYNILVSFFVVEYEFFNRFTLDENLIKQIKLGKWFSILETKVSWNLLLDNLSITMLVVVLTISACVHIYSYYYMEYDQNFIKFFSYLTLFTFFMCILVVSSNFVLLFIGWEGVGLCSFLLISFWNTRVQANKAALKAMLINRVGDFFLLIAMILIILNFKSLDYFAVFAQAHVYSLKSVQILNFNITIIDLISIFIVLGAITKSAQLGFHGWLPDAMEGPTPVSALIHAATMVTAGVYLLIRTSYLIEFSEIALKFLTYIGGLSAFIFGIVAFFQYDIKKIIAFSTCSQLGFMILACGLSGYNIAFFHLFIHAFFKALLFLIAGSYIHLMGNEQDIRKMGRAFEKSPAISVFFIIGSFTLMGFPFLSSFYSKEPILQIAFLYTDNLAIFVLVQAASIFTILYSLKLYYFLYFKENFNKRNFFKTKTYSKSAVYGNSVLIILCILSVVAGYLTKTFFIGAGSNFFYGSIFIKHSIPIDYEFVPFYIKTIPLTALISLIFLFYKYIKYTSFFAIKPSHISKNLFLFFNKKLFFDSLVNLFIAFPVYRLSYKLFFIFDKGILEMIGSYGMSKTIKFFNKFSYQIFEADRFESSLKSIGLVAAMVISISLILTNFYL